jgi:hypothetical protein
VPRRTWLDDKIDLFLEEPTASGMHLARQRAGELISGQVRAVAILMGVTETSARSYLDDEIIKDMARRMLFEVAGEQPSADLMEAHGPSGCRWASWGSPSRPWPRRCGSGRRTSRPITCGDVITTYAQALSGLGQIAADAAPEQAGDPAGISFPPALLRRAARYISGAADLAANGGKLPDEIPETARSQLATTLRRDADGLIASRPPANQPHQGTRRVPRRRSPAQRGLSVRATRQEYVLNSLCPW